MSAELSQQMVNLIFSILIGLVAMLVTAVRRWILTHSGAEGVATMEIIARNSINAVEQIYKSQEVHGVEKLAHAKMLFIEGLGKKGLKVTDEQLTLFLESAVKVMNDEINNHGNNDDKIVK